MTAHATDSPLPASTWAFKKPTMKRALVLCSKYSQMAADSWLTDEMVGALEARGHEVTIVAIGDVTEAGPEATPVPNRKEHLFPARGPSRFAKYVKAWPAATSTLLRERCTEFDVVIAFAPLSVLWPLVLVTTRLFSARKLIAIVFDIFPRHQVEIGRIPRLFRNVFRMTEARLLERFDVVTGQSPRNVERIREYYGFDDTGPRLQVLYLWGARASAETRRSGPSTDEIKMVFGGQIVAGRDLDALVRLLKEIRSRGVPVTLTIFSAGGGWRSLKERCVGEVDWLLFRDRLPREAYLSEISGYDVGVFVTDARVTMPTFPSKVIDYMNAGLRCFGMVEAESDIDVVIGDDEFLHVNRFQFDEPAVRRAIAFLRRCRDSSGLEAYRGREKFSVATAVDSLL